MEIWDIYDKYIRKTGANHGRGITMKIGDDPMKKQMRRKKQWGKLNDQHHNKRYRHTSNKEKG